MPRPVLAAALLLATASSLAAQDARFDSTGRDTRIRVGTRVRFVRDTTGTPIEGRVVTLAGDVMDVELLQSRLRESVGLRDVARLDVQRRNGDLAAVLGVAGAITGTGVYVKWCLVDDPIACREVSERDTDDDGDIDEDDDNSLFSILTSAAAGGYFLGRALGYLLTPPSWQRVDQPFRVGVMPTRHGVLLYASITIR